MTPCVPLMEPAVIPETWFLPPEGFTAPPGFASKSGAADAEPEELPGLYYTKTWLARFD